MDLNGNKEADSDVAPSEPSVDAIASNVQSLKLFFQKQKQPIIGFKPVTSTHADSSPAPDQQSVSLRSESSEDKPTNRSHRSIPRPPKQIQSCDIKVPPFIKSLVSSQCERSVPPMHSVPPVPMPRRSLLQKKTSYDSYEPKESSEVKSSYAPNFEIKRSLDVDLRPNSLIESLTKELVANQTKSRTHSLHYSPKPIAESNGSDSQSHDVSADSPQPPNPTICATNISLETLQSMSSKKQSSSKSKKPFKMFLRRSKLLSLRKSSSPDKKCQNIEPNIAANMRPIKPTRAPPNPPVLHFRPAAPLPPEEPNEDYYEDTLSSGLDNPSTAGYELYNDNDNLETEQIYCSLDNEEDRSDSDIYDRIDDYDDGRYDKSYDNYYEDSESVDNLEGIYEVLPFEDRSESDSIASNSTISLDDNQNKVERVSESEQRGEEKMSSFEIKQNLKALKLKKKFNLNGDEIPVNAGVVKEDNKGNRYDLLVRKGETVLILRMEGNPPGKYLAKNERSKVGFVSLDNISFDAESVKCIINTLVSTRKSSVETKE